MKRIIKIRIFLIVFLILNLSCGISALLLSRNQSNVEKIALLVFILIINAICSNYLYKKAPKDKIEWALFGFMGNLSAIIIYHFKNYVVSRWSGGKSIFKA
jgi:hypothetical protein